MARPWTIKALVPAALAAGCLIAGWRVVEELNRGPTPAQLPAGPGPAAQGEPLAALPTEPNVVMAPAGAFRATVERPLFSQDRRPAPPPKVVQAPAPKLPLNLHLHGIIHSPGSQLAVVSPKGKLDMLRLPVGANYRGWTIKDIGPKDVTFVLDGVERKLELKFDGEGLGQRKLRPRPREK